MFSWGDYRRGRTTNELNQNLINKDGLGNKDALGLYSKIFACGGGVPTFWSINWAAALMHLLNAFLTFMLWDASDSKDNVFKLSEQYTAWQPRANSTAECGIDAFPISDEWCIANATVSTSELSLWWLIIVFHFLSFAFQALAMAEWDFSFCGYKCVRTSYIEEVDNEGTNSLRMIEYSISATLMQVSIALILSVWSALTMLGIVFLTIVTMLLGLVAEKLKYIDLGLAWTVHFIGWSAMGAVWTILGRKFALNISMAPSGGGPPAFVYVIVVVIAILYSGFGLVQFFDLMFTGKDKKTAKSHHRKVEMAYCMLSLISKTFLGWIIFSNALVGMARNN